jgi:hypothetical protein
MKHYHGKVLNVWKCTQSTKFCQSYTLMLKKTNHYCKEGPHVKNIVLPTYNNSQIYTWSNLIMHIMGQKKKKMQKITLVT